MDPNKLTMKSQTALQEAHAQALARNHQSIEPEHVLMALLGDPDGIVYPLLHQLNANPSAIRSTLEAALDKIPKVYSGADNDPRLSATSSRLLESAGAEAEALTDEYVSTEHLILAMLASPDSPAARVLAD